MHGAGRSVRVGIRDGCIIHEIRPWRITKSADPLGGPEIRKALEKIFTLDGTAPSESLINNSDFYRKLPQNAYVFTSNIL
jgi:hypothetical protein